MQDGMTTHEHRLNLMRMRDGTNSLIKEAKDLAVVLAEADSRRQGDPERMNMNEWYKIIRCIEDIRVDVDWILTCYNETCPSTLEIADEPQENAQ